jgi:hypothetical protein
MIECGAEQCCRCERGKGYVWGQAYSFGPHILCPGCRTAIVGFLSMEPEEPGYCLGCGEAEGAGWDPGGGYEPLTICPECSEHVLSEFACGLQAGVEA